MPDEEGKTTATEETSTPLHAYKDGREEDVKEGDLGANPDQEDMPAGSDQPSQYHDGEPPSGDEGDVEREPAGPGGEIEDDSGIGTQTEAVQGPEEGGPGLGQEPDGDPTRNAG